MAGAAALVQRFRLDVAGQVEQRGAGVLGLHERAGGVAGAGAGAGDGDAEAAAGAGVGVGHVHGAGLAAGGDGADAAVAGERVVDGEVGNANDAEDGIDAGVREDSDDRIPTGGHVAHGRSSKCEVLSTAY